MIESPFRPVALTADPEFDVFRRLHPEEVPATLSLALGDPSLVIVLPTGGSEESRAAYRALAGQLSRSGEARVVEDREAAAGDLGKASLFILGGPAENGLHTALLAGGPPGDVLPAGVRLDEASLELNGKSYPEEGAAILISLKNPRNPGKGICVFAGLSPEAISTAGGKLTHYGKYSFLAFVSGENRDKGIWEPSGGPLRFEFGEVPTTP